MDALSLCFVPTGKFEIYRCPKGKGYLQKNKAQPRFPVSHELDFMGVSAENQHSVFGGERMNSGTSKALPERQCRGIWSL